MENTLTVSLLDTNILVYANNEDSPFHATCKALVEKAIRSQIRAAIAIQNLIELYTDKRRVEHPLSPLKAKELIDFLQRSGSYTMHYPHISDLQYRYRTNR